MKLFRTLALGLALPFDMLPCLPAQQAPVTTPMEHQHKFSAPSTSLTLTGNGKTLTFSIAELRAMPAAQRHRAQRSQQGG